LLTAGFDDSDGNMMFELAKIDEKTKKRTYNGVSCTSTFGDCGGNETFTLTFDPVAHTWSLFYSFERQNERRGSNQKSQKFTGTVLLTETPGS